MITDYLALDLETTGLSPDKDRVIEIGAVKYHEGKRGEQYSCLVRIGMPLPERITKLTGITQEMLAEGVSEQEAVMGFFKFASDMPILLGHNISFDYSFLKVAAVRWEQEFERRGLDTLQFARILHLEMESRSLASLCAHYKIDQGHAHRAVDDAVAAHDLYAALQKAFPDYDFLSVPLFYKPKKQEPMTLRQKKYLQDLLRSYFMEYTTDMDFLTKSEASRMIDKLILTKGKISENSK